MGYLNIEEIHAGLNALAAAYPDLCDLITLPNKSTEGRDIGALSLGDKRDATQSVALFVGGLHAREWVPPDALLYLAADLLEARASGTGLIYGGYRASAEEILNVFSSLQILILPCANPDGRLYSQTVESMWRKNRSDNGTCRGVDLNRNFDVAWDFQTAFAPNAVSASADPCNFNVYVGPSAVSEPETKNVVWLMDEFRNTRWYVDVHSAIPAIFHSWGLDENQSANPEMNLTNPDFDGERGRPSDIYGEFITKADMGETARLARLMAAAIEKFRGETYEVAQAYSLYATSGASDDYAYSRHIQDVTLPKILSFTMECGRDFQPDWDEAENVIQEVCAALVSLCQDSVRSTATSGPSMNI